MTATQPKEAALDEIQWRSVPSVQRFGGIHTNSVHHYFMESPFFDPTSNNNTLRTQAQFNPAMVYLLQTREAFEARLRTMQGLEFMVVAEPQQLQEGDTGVWTIRKQVRRKQQGAEDELTVLATYYVIGENIYQAPSLENMIGSKILSAATSLGKFFALAAKLPTFSPAHGHSYSMPVTKSKTSQAIRDSKPSTPENEEQSQSQNDQPNKENASPGNGASAHDSLALFDSLNLSLRFESEYMDENPLQGEPGSFVFSATKERLHAQHQRQEQEQAKLQTQDRQSVSAAPTPTPDPRAGAAAGAGVVPPRKGSKSEKGSTATSAPPKPKRRKSKAPTSPMDITPPDAKQA